MDAGRKLVIFPVDQFYAVVGNVTLPKDPYGISLIDVLNERSALTHRQGDHEHRPGRIFLTDAEFYTLHDNTRRICTVMTEIFIPVQQVRAVVDVHPERYQGSADKRRESQERVRRSRELLFALHGHAVRGVAEALEIYRKSDQFVGLTRVAIDEEPATTNGLSLTAFLHHLGCPPPDFMAVNLRRVIHS
jgi:hypothetical protein